MADDDVEQSGQSELMRFEVTRMCNSSSVTLMDVMSSPSGNGSKGVVGIPLRLLLKSNEESVASFHRITRGSPKSIMSQLYIGFYNMSESVQRIIKRRALQGYHTYDVEILKEWLTDAVIGWNRHPTPFIWGGKRHARRDRAYARRHRMGGSGATTASVVPRRIRSVRYYRRQLKPDRTWQLT